MTAFRFSRVEPGETLAFTCGKPDLDTFFADARPALESKLYVVSYKLCLEAGVGNPVALVCLANDVLRSGQLYVKPPHNWPFEYTPAIRIAAFGVAMGYQGKGVGQTVIPVLQSLFVLKNRTGCRYMTVDAYSDIPRMGINSSATFYQKYCDFSTMPLNPEANRAKPPKVKRNQDGTTPLYYDLNVMQKALEEEADLMEEMTAIQKSLAETGTAELNIPMGDDAAGFGAAMGSGVSV